MNLVLNFWVTIFGTFHKMNLMTLGPGSATDHVINVTCINAKKDIPKEVDPFFSDIRGLTDRPACGHL